MKLEFSKFDIILTQKPAEYRWLKHLDIEKATNVGEENLDKWLLRTKDGTPFGYIGCVMEKEIGQLEIMEFGCLINVNPDVLSKALKVIGSGSVYGEDQSVAFVPAQDWKSNHIIRRGGFEEFLPQEPWVEMQGKYYIKENKVK